MKCFVSVCESDFHCYKYIDEHEQAGFSVHRFPRDLQRRLAWIQAISNAENRDIHVDTVNFTVVRLCSKHFLESDFYCSHGRKMLNKTAIPSVFDNHASSRCVGSVPSINSSLLCILHDSGFSDANESVALLPTVPAPNESDSPHLPPLKRKRCDNPIGPVDSSQLYTQQDFGINKTVESLSTEPMPDDHNSLPCKRRRTIRYAGDVKDDITAEEALIAVPKIKMQLTRSQKTIKLLRGQNKRLRDRLNSMEDLFNKLKTKKFISDSSHVVLQDYSSNNSLFEELKSRIHGQPYSDALRSFATTLHFYSPKAYTYVRGVFNKTLPHPRTIIRWYESINGEPGITKEALDALKLKAAEMNSQGKQLLGCLMMDEMAIRQQVVWNEQTKKLEGVAYLHPAQTTDPNAKSTAEQIPAAKEALVFMVTGVQAPWKIPVAYFLIKGLNATEKKDIINTILSSLHEAGVLIIALTFDGTCTNIATVNALGCDIRGNSKSLKTCFKHPTSNHDVYVLLDPVHMLKLIRNTLHKQKVLITPNGSVKWQYIEKLNQHQTALGLKLAPKLSDKHIYFENSKMKVLLAVQVISNSVATALEQLSSIEPEFNDCSATIEFLHLFNDLFDLTNSMDKNAAGFKKPLSSNNFDLYHNAFAYIEHFIRNIKLSDGSSVLGSRCKTGFLGFLVAIESFKNLYRIYVEEMGILDNIFTYWFSQDHLEHFFGAIRAKSGSNNNPNAAQFKASYKRLIVNNAVVNPSTGNCQNFEKVDTLKAMNVSREKSSYQERHQAQIDAFHTEYLIDYDYESFKTDVALSLSIQKHAEEAERKLLGNLKCVSCVNYMSKYGTVTITSVCKAAEYEFKMLIDDQQNVNIEKYYNYIVTNSLSRAYSEIENLFDHFPDHELCAENHKSDVLRRIVDIYVNIRIKLYSKKMVAFKPTNRQKLTKLILFEGN